MLPSVYTQDRHHIRTTWRQTCLIPSVPAHSAESADVVVVAVGVVGVGVNALLSVPCFREWSAGGVGGEDAPPACAGGWAAARQIAGPDEPDEAWCKHRGRSIEERRAQSLNRAERPRQAGFEATSNIDESLRRRRERGVEEVVVPCHARVVEDGGGHRVAGVLQDQGLDVAVLVWVAREELVQFLDDARLVV